MKRKADDEILKEALERFANGFEADRENRDADLEDRHFLAGEQYPEDVLEARRGRPCEVFNRLPQFVKQVTGEMRQNKPAIRVLPVDDTSDPELAEVYAAIIRHIESKSDAHRIYVRAGEHAVQGGIGWFRVTAAYEDDGFDQELRIEHIRNPNAVIDDPDARGLLREDANFRFVTEMMGLADFKRQYPKAAVIEFDTSTSTFSDDARHWGSEEQVRVAEYWRRVPITKRMIRLVGGAVHDVSGMDGGDTLAPGDVIQMPGGKPVQIDAVRDVKSHKVEWFILNGAEILERGEWKGNFIPIIPVLGEEVAIGERIVRHGIIRYAKGAQRSHNYFRNAAAEYAALQPKAPWVGTAKQISPYKSMWDKANTANLPYLLYDHDPQAPGPPQRSMPPASAGGFYEEAQQAGEDMKAITGIYDASLGNRSNETSGVAIRAREAQGDTVTFVYLDNLSAAIKMAGRILVDLIPHYYSGDRVVRIMGEDDSIKGYAAINRILPDGRVWNDLTQGKYDVEVVTGPAFATKRQEAADRLLGLIQAVPQLAELAGDKIVRALDIPYGDDIAERLERAIPPALDPEGAKKRAEKEGPPQPDPAQQEALAMQREALILDLEEKRAKVAKLQAETMAAGQQPDQGPTEAMALAEAVKAEQELEAKLREHEMTIQKEITIADIRANAAVRQAAMVAKINARMGGKSAPAGEGDEADEVEVDYDPDAAVKELVQEVGALVERVNAPRVKQIIRDEAGNIVQVIETVAGEG